MNHERIVTELILIAEMFDAALSETKIQGYLEALDDIPDDEIVSAMHETVKRCKFFPRVAEIREIVYERRNNREREHQQKKRFETLNRAKGYAERWEKDRKELPVPIPIKSLVEKVAKQLDVKTPDEIEERKRQLREQAESVKDETKPEGAKG